MEKGQSKIIKGMTKSGFRFEIQENIVNDWETTELLSQVEDNPYSVVKVFKRLLGIRQYENLKKHMKKICGGTIPTQKMMDAFNDIMSVNTETKN